MVPPRYIGKIEYCYSNSVSMMLFAGREWREPSLVEVMTGMGIGAHMSKSGLLFFDCTEPDIGISRALRSLGFEFDEASSADSAHAPFEQLRKLLKRGPVVIGPLEFAKLLYNPKHGSGDSDHYVLAYGMDDARVFVHDPWGFPCALITYADLEVAWRAEAVGYKRGYFRYWSNPRVVERPDLDEQHKRVMATCEEVYTKDRAKIESEGKLTGAAAIQFLADHVRQTAPEEWQTGFLTEFSLPLAAKRSLDYADFFNARNHTLAMSKYESASLFGAAGSHAVAGEWSKLADVLEQLAEKEVEFESLVLTTRSG